MGLQFTRAPVGGFANVGRLAGAWLLWADANGEPQRARINRAAFELPIETAQLARQPAQYFQRHHYEGFYWCAGTRRHHWYESLEEMTALMSLDHQYRLRAVSSQPFELRFDDGSKHTPDFFAVHDDGSRVVYDVKATERIKGDVAEKFALTKDACDQIGWGYEVLTELTRAERHNLEWIASYRRDRYAPTAAETRTIRDLLRTPQPLGEIRERIPRIHHLYNLMWRREIDFDGSQPLTLHTTLERAAPTHSTTATTPSSNPGRERTASATKTPASTACSKSGSSARSSTNRSPATPPEQRNSTTTSGTASTRYWSNAKRTSSR